MLTRISRPATWKVFHRFFGFACHRFAPRGFLSGFFRQRYVS